ncbi:MAG TPA: ABC transporter ATP-binding protein [Candidatus Dormibacteraeota bacterium]|nr:ABC transporter ATP-binding protein [Candidatus Dormibacteraeota bacterium]
MLSIADLEVSYGGTTRALRGVDLEVPRGAIVAVVGANGAGKTTLMRSISGTLGLEGGRIVRGRIDLDGRDITRLDPADVVRLGIVQVPEGRRIFSRLTVAENLRMGAFTTTRAAERAALRRVLDLFPWIAERMGERAALLSGGQQQMLAISRALMSQPQLLLLDEPSLGLAPIIAEQVADVIRRINRAGTTVLLVEQNTAMALDLGNIAAVLHLGRVVRVGDADELAASGEIERLFMGIDDGATSGAK